jgi:hypothetical protein
MQIWEGSKKDEGDSNFLNSTRVLLQKSCLASRVASALIAN